MQNKRFMILIRSLPKVGIAALIDEATGYQYDRENTGASKIINCLYRRRINDE